jgi:hypothetical protein
LPVFEPRAKRLRVTTKPWLGRRRVAEYAWDDETCIVYAAPDDEGNTDHWVTLARGEESTQLFRLGTRAGAELAAADLNAAIRARLRG